MKCILAVALLWVCVAASDPSLTTPTPTATTEFQKPPTAVKFPGTTKSTASQYGGYQKRDVKSGDSSSSASTQNYDPAPEYYRGPGSSASKSSSSSSTLSSNPSTYGNHQDSATASFLTKPVSTKYDSTSYQANEYNNWQAVRGGLHAQDRISVKHYGSPEHGTVPAYTSGPGSYQYDIRPYGGGGGSVSHYYDSAVGGGGVSAGVGGGGGGGGYYGSDYAGGIPFDVYGHKGAHGSGVEYSPYPVYGHEEKGQPELSQKALLAKSFLIPLASAAVLGIAAALVSNPLLLQLGTVGGGIIPPLAGKRRRRRDLADSGRRPSAKTTDLPYKAHIRQ